jgi:hypothetical protein
MKKITITITITMALIFMSFTNVDLVTKHLFDNQVTVKIPSTFRELSKKERFSDFPRNNTPAVAFVNKTETVYITFNLQQLKKATQNDIKKYLDHYVELHNYFGTCTNSGIFKNKDKKFGFVTTDGLKRSQKLVYTTMSFTDAAGMILECTFYCPADKKEQWKETADDIIKSFTVIAE